MRDLSDVERLRRGAWMIGAEEHETWVRKAQAATEEERAPDRPRSAPYVAERRLMLDEGFGAVRAASVVGHKSVSPFTVDRLDCGTLSLVACRPC